MQRSLFTWTFAVEASLVIGAWDGEVIRVITSESAIYRALGHFSRTVARDVPIYHVALNLGEVTAGTKLEFLCDGQLFSVAGATAWVVVVDPWGPSSFARDWWWCV